MTSHEARARGRAARPPHCGLAGLLAAASLAGCVGLSQYQLPVTTPAGSAVAHCAVGGIIAPPDEADEAKEDGGVDLVPLIDAGVRFGLTDFMDVGLRLGFYGIDLSLKVQLLNMDVKVAFSPTLRPAINFDSFSAILPLLIGVVTDDFGLTLTPIAAYSSKDGGQWGGGLSLAPMARVDQSWVGVEVTASTPIEGEDAWSEVGWEAAVVYILGF